jgi:hypothetical protein
MIAYKAFAMCPIYPNPNFRLFPKLGLNIYIMMRCPFVVDMIRQEIWCITFKCITIFCGIDNCSKNVPTLFKLNNVMHQIMELKNVMLFTFKCE